MSSGNSDCRRSEKRLDATQVEFGHYNAPAYETLGQALQAVGSESEANEMLARAKVLQEEFDSGVKKALSDTPMLPATINQTCE